MLLHAYINTYLCADWLDHKIMLNQLEISTHRWAEAQPLSNRPFSHSSLSNDNIHAVVVFKKQGEPGDMVNTTLFRRKCVYT